MTCTPEQIAKLGEHLLGTCNSFEEGLEACGLRAMDDNEVDDARVRVEQDCEIFLCDVCGWWCENSELHNEVYDQHCDDCDE